jgi:hypothetical protein
MQDINKSMTGTLHQGMKIITRASKIKPNLNIIHASEEFAIRYKTNGNIKSKATAIRILKTIFISKLDPKNKPK